MAKTPHDGHPLQLVCPRCGLFIHETLAWFRNAMACPLCRGKLSPSDFSAGISELERLLRLTDDGGGE